MEQLVVPAIVGAIAALSVDALKATIGRVFKKWDDAAVARQADFEALRTIVFEIRDLSAEYWERPGSDPCQKTRQASIVGRLTYVLKIQSDLFDKHEILARDVGLEVHRFYDACTNGDFGSAERSAFPERCTDVEICAYTLVHSCQTALRKLK